MEDIGAATLLLLVLFIEETGHHLSRGSAQHPVHVKDAVTCDLEGAVIHGIEVFVPKAVE